MLAIAQNISISILKFHSSMRQVTWTTIFQIFMEQLKIYKIVWVLTQKLKRAKTLLRKLKWFYIKGCPLNCSKIVVKIPFGVMEKYVKRTSC